MSDKFLNATIHILQQTNNLIARNRLVFFLKFADTHTQDEKTLFIHMNLTWVFLRFVFPFFFEVRPQTSEVCLEVPWHHDPLVCDVDGDWGPSDGSVAEPPRVSNHCPWPICWFLNGWRASISFYSKKTSPLAQRFWLASLCWVKIKIRITLVH